MFLTQQKRLRPMPLRLTKTNREDPRKSTQLP